MARNSRVICASSALAEGGTGVCFVRASPGAQGRGFAVRYDGAVRAFVNRCPHLGVELDWQPGEFFEETGLYLVCSTHGAIFEPSTGLCIAGPCRGARLQAIAVEECQGLILIHDGCPEPVPGNDSANCP